MRLRLRLRLRLLPRAGFVQAFVQAHQENLPKVSALGFAIG